MISRRIRLLSIAVTIGVTGCMQHDRLTSPHSQYPDAPPASPMNAHEVAIVVSDLTPTSGNIVVVAAVLRVSDSLTLGSFVARMTYDPAKLHYLGESDADEMMRVVNAEQGKLTVAAASSSGSKTGRLFTFRFRADDPAGITSLLLSIDALNDAKYVNRLSMIHLAPEARLDKRLAPKRVNTR